MRDRSRAPLRDRSRTPVRGLFVTGTGTGVGKTVVSAALLAAMRAAGEQVRAHKPVVTGLDEPTNGWPPDHELLASVAGMTPEEVAPLGYGLAVSPHLAAEMAGETIEPSEVIARARAAGAGEGARGGAGVDANGGAGGRGALVVEGVGGLLVPLTDEFTVRDLAVALGLPLLIAAAPGLGTINHTLLTLQSARAAGLDVRAVVLTPWPGAPGNPPGELERSNRETIARLGEVEVACLGRVQSPNPAELARAGGRLAWQKWCPPTSAVSSGQ
jgi:dethiobiotin synthetase